jgi:hypothetical protein
VACENFRAERRANGLVNLPPTLNAAIEHLAKSTKRKFIILSVASLDRCEIDRSPGSAIGTISPEMPRRSLSKPGAAPASAAAAASTASAAAPASASASAATAAGAAPSTADSKGDEKVEMLALKDSYQFKFTVRNTANGTESVAEAWASVYKNVRSDAPFERDGSRPCQITEVVGGWTKK